MLFIGQTLARSPEFSPDCIKIRFVVFYGCPPLFFFNCYSWCRFSMIVAIPYSPPCVFPVALALQVGS